jgi:pimeloyl-ACP methyl ester carboxylesterase
MKTFTRTFVFLTLLAFVGLSAVGQRSMDYTILVEDVEILPGITIDINVNAYVNENAAGNDDAGKIYAIEGMAHTANCWKPLAEELFAETDPALEINEFFAIDMPGRGGSGLPKSDTFLMHNLYMDHYLNIEEGVLNYLNQTGINPKIIMGHSMGGMQVFLLQNRLIDQGTNLKEAYGFEKAILLAPGIPAPLDWAFLTNGGSTALLPYAEFIPGMGTVLNLPTTVWPFVFFTNANYVAPNMVPGAPTPAEVEEYGYCGIEAGPLLFELSGMEPPPPYPYKPRLSADPDLFIAEHGTELIIIAEEFDKMMAPEEEEELYIYFTGDEQKTGLRIIYGEETCHDTHISEPSKTVLALYYPTGIDDITGLNASLMDMTVSPNPARSTVNLTVTLENGGNVNLALFDCRGVEVMQMADTYIQPGTEVLEFNVSELTPGIYFCRLESEGLTLTGKLVRR